ncbi:MAG: DinB family protein [Gemmatimonadota bacterium]
MAMDRETKHHSILANELTSTAEGFHAAIAGLHADQWSFKPTPDTWSILQNAEHVALVEDGVCRLLVDQLASMPLTEDQRRGLKSRDPLVTAAMFDRKTRISAPGFVSPTGRYGDPTEAGAVFESAMLGIVDWLQSTTLDLRGHGAPHPRLGVLDGKQWVLMAAAHVERHTHQILDLKKDPQYPAT